VDESVRGLLQLLADDAPAAELARAADRVAAEDPAARDLALRIRAGMDASKRRETELSTLIDIARELASAREPGGVLDTIVHRARTLIGTDVAYLTLYDAARGDTFMRATDGSVSAAFQQLRLPLGAGLGGLVAETHTPYWTADYPADLRFRHTMPIDEAVGEEGLVAICGTPLIVDGACCRRLMLVSSTLLPRTTGSPRSSCLVGMWMRSRRRWPSCSVLWSSEAGLGTVAAGAGRHPHRRAQRYCRSRCHRRSRPAADPRTRPRPGGQGTT
jgi:hypothetical protein